MNKSVTQGFHFKQISQAIQILRDRQSSPPSLSELAAEVGMSVSHFQKVFTRWAGVSPKQFSAYLTLNYAKSILKSERPTLFDVADKVGLSGTGRLHDLFVKIEAMRPGEYKNGGNGLVIYYQYMEGIYGNMLAAATDKGLCYLAFVEDETEDWNQLQNLFPRATFYNQWVGTLRHLHHFFQSPHLGAHPFSLHIKGTPFQLKVWEALLQIPNGKLTTYGKLSAQINNPKAARAVGTAIGSNPIAYLIPCHRVIRQSGVLGGYKWGTDLKVGIIAHEGVQYVLNKNKTPLKR